MKFYVQYVPVDGQTYGLITATVSNTLANNPPICEDQLVFDEYMDTDGMVVDLATKTLVPDPNNPA